MARKSPTPLLLLLAALACEVNDPASEPLIEAVQDDADTPTPRSVPDTSCVEYCESRQSTFRERCLAENGDEALCDDAWSAAFGACVQTQCGLVVQLPDVAGMEVFAQQRADDLFGPHFSLDSVVPHYYDDEGQIDTRVYRFVSSEDGSAAFLEVGATLQMPPVVSYGFGETADVALGEAAVQRLNEAFGESDYTLERRYFSAAHPVLEYTTPTGDRFYYAAATGDVSDILEIEDDPEIDASTRAIRSESFKREWDRYLP